MRQNKTPEKKLSCQGGRMKTATYVVQSGDNLSQIAWRHGLSTWRELYDLPENAEFRSKHPQHSMIYPGNEIHVPVLGAALNRLGARLQVR